MIEETIITVDLSDHNTLMECYVGLNKSFRKQKERIAELEAALKPFDEMLQRDFSIMADDKRYADDFTSTVLMRLGDLRAARAAYLGEKE